MTSNDLQGHALSASLLKCDFSYSCAAADKISRQHVAWSPYTRAELLVLTNMKNQRILRSTTVTVKRILLLSKCACTAVAGRQLQCPVTDTPGRSSQPCDVNVVRHCQQSVQTLNASNGPTAGPIWLAGYTTDSTSVITQLAFAYLQTSITYTEGYSVLYRYFTVPYYDDVYSCMHLHDHTNQPTPFHIHIHTRYWIHSITSLSNHATAVTFPFILSVILNV